MNGAITMTGEEYDAIAAENAKLRERVAELETDLKLTSEMLVGVSRKGMALQEELATLKSAPVVMPSEQHLREILDDLEDDDGCSRDDVSYGFRMAIGLITRLNRSKTNEQ